MSVLATLGIVAATQWTNGLRIACNRLTALAWLNWSDRHRPALALDGGAALHPHDHDHDHDHDHGDGLVLMAVPKRKTTRARKRLRHKSKWLQNIQHYDTCPTCGGAMLFQRLCGKCLKRKLMETATMRRKGL